MMHDSGVNSKRWGLYVRVYRIIYAGYKNINGKLEFLYFIWEFKRQRDLENKFSFCILPFDLDSNFFLRGVRGVVGTDADLGPKMKMRFFKKRLGKWRK